LKYIYKSGLNDHDHKEDKDVDSRIILKWRLKYTVRGRRLDLCGSLRGPFKYDNESSGSMGEEFIDRLNKSLASQEKLCIDGVL
jgi:hypothetical protein